MKKQNKTKTYGKAYSVGRETKMNPKIGVSFLYFLSLPHEGLLASTKIRFHPEVPRSEMEEAKEKDAIKPNESMPPNHCVTLRKSFSFWHQFFHLQNEEAEQKSLTSLLAPAFYNLIASNSLVLTGLNGTQ